MTDRMIQRRTFLRGASLSAGALTVASLAHRAAAQTKATQAVAKYQNHPKGQQRCEICVNFQPPNQCTIVEGPISPQGWCQFFAAKENAQ
jgi:hypothetical protein